MTPLSSRCRFPGPRVASKSADQDRLGVTLPHRCVCCLDQAGQGGMGHICPAARHVARPAPTVPLYAHLCRQLQRSCVYSRLHNHVDIAFNLVFAQMSIRQLRCKKSTLGISPGLLSIDSRQGRDSPRDPSLLPLRAPISAPDPSRAQTRCPLTGKILPGLQAVCRALSRYTDERVMREESE